MITDEKVREVFKEFLDLPDVLTAAQRMLPPGQRSYRFDSRIKFSEIFRGVHYSTWENAPDGGCVRHFGLFQIFDVIPQYCMDCYKVFVEVNTVAELFKLLLIFEEIQLTRDNTRKCMIDQRAGTKTHYKGFIYCRSIEEARNLQVILEELVSEEIGTHSVVSIKRGCTEFGNKYAAYQNFESQDEPFQYNKEWHFLENFFDHNWKITYDSDFNEEEHGIDRMRELFAMQFWLRFAATVGDHSYLALTGGKTLKPLPTAKA